MNKDPKAEEFIQKKAEWKEILEPLRKIFLEEGLEETIKWGTPVYTLNGKNVAGLGAFKSYAGIWFFQGALLKDPEKVLVNAQKGTTKALRQWRFTAPDQMKEDLVRSYVKEAIENQKAGKEIKPAKKRSFEIPEELNEAMANDPSVKEGFESLSHSKKREYAEHIGGAKKEETRANRLEKAIPSIRAGKGLNDKYKKK